MMMMISLLKRERITALWLLLIVLTLLSLEYFRDLGHGSDYRLGSVVVMIIAFIKVRLVGLDYMELRNAPLPLRLVFEVWVIGLCSVIITLYYLAGH